MIGVDVAEGKEFGDESAAPVLRDDGEQVAELVGRIELGVYAEYLIALHEFYNRAYMNIERNNHGHAILLRLHDKYRRYILKDRDGNRGYMSSTRGKAELYSVMAETARDKKTVIRSQKAMDQLLSIERATLLAPKNCLDDVADGYSLACVGIKRQPWQSVGGDVMEV